MAIEAGIKLGYKTINVVNPVGDNFVTGVWKGIGIYCSTKHSDARKQTIAGKVQKMDDELFAEFHP